MMKIFWKYLIILTSLFLFIFNSHAQTYPADSIFQEARQTAFKGEYPTAIRICQEILNNVPEYHEVAVFMSRVYGWNKQYDSSLFILKKLMQKIPDSRDLWQTLTDISKWAEQYDDALAYSDSALNYFPDDSIFLYQKAELYFLKGDYTQAKEIINELLNIYPDHQKAKNLKKQIKQQVTRNIISPDYYFHLFDNPFVWRLHIVTLDYGLKTKKGTYFAGINIGDLIINHDHPLWQKPSFQFKLELYPRFNPRQYGFFNYSFGINRVFPRHRLGLEFYQQIKNSYEISAGLRYLQFPLSDSNKAYIFTVSLSYQKGLFWLLFRPYLSLTPKGTGHAFTFEMRKFLRSDEHFLSLYTGFGNNPDELRNNTGNLEIYNLKSYKLLLGLQHHLFDNHLFLVKSGLSFDEYNDGKYRLSYEFFIKFYLRY